MWHKEHQDPGTPALSTFGTGSRGSKKIIRSIHTFKNTTITWNEYEIVTYEASRTGTSHLHTFRKGPIWQSAFWTGIWRWQEYQHSGRVHERDVLPPSFALRFDLQWAWNKLCCIAYDQTRLSGRSTSSRRLAVAGLVESTARGFT